MASQPTCGLHAPGALADQLGLGTSLSSRIAPRGERMPLHDRGKVLVQMALVLAGGGESCADIEHLRAQAEMFGSVPSDSTVFRTLHEFNAEQRSELSEASAEVRAKVWKKLDQRRKDPVILDFDASLVDVHSELKEQTAPNYKGGFGFHPLFVFSDLTGETLSCKLRAGNATANNASDHVELLDAALRQLPCESREDTASVTIRRRPRAASSHEPTARVAPKSSSPPVESATCHSSSRHARMPRSRALSTRRSTSLNCGSLRAPRPVNYARGPRSVS